MYKIWIINHHAVTKGRHTNFSKKLTERGHKVTLFASSFKHNTYKELKDYPPGKFSLEEEEDGYRRIWIKTTHYNRNGIKRFISQIAFLYRTFKSGLKMDKPDVIIGSSVHLFAALAGYLLSKFKKTPFIFEVRDFWPQTLIDLGVLQERNPVTIFFKILEKFLYKKADKIISVLPHGDKYISSLGIDKEKVVHIPNGVDLKWFDKFSEKKDLPAKLADYFSIVNGLVFSYTGAHGLTNGLDTIVEAARIVEERGIIGINFLLVGDGPEKERLIRKAEKWKLTNITFIPGVDKDFVPAILTNSDVCLFHLKKTDVFKYGISSRKIFDYLASGKPMISAVRASFDFADIAECGFSIPPEDPVEFANAVIRMAEMSEEERKKLGLNGRNFVESHHDYSVLTERMERLIKSVIENKGM